MTFWLVVVDWFCEITKNVILKQLQENFCSNFKRMFGHIGDLFVLLGVMITPLFGISGTWRFKNGIKFLPQEDFQ